jgi:hypothetical protein
VSKSILRMPCVVCVLCVRQNKTMPSLRMKETIEEERKTATRQSRSPLKKAVQEALVRLHNTNMQSEVLLFTRRDILFPFAVRMTIESVKVRHYWASPRVDLRSFVLAYGTLFAGVLIHGNQSTVVNCLGIAKPRG